MFVAHKLSGFKVSRKSNLAKLKANVARYDIKAYSTKDI